MSAESLKNRLEALERGRSADLVPKSLEWFYGEPEPAIKPSQAKPRTLADFYRQNEGVKK